MKNIKWYLNDTKKTGQKFLTNLKSISELKTSRNLAEVVTQLNKAEGIGYEPKKLPA